MINDDPVPISRTKSQHLVDTDRNLSSFHNNTPANNSHCVRLHNDTHHLGVHVATVVSVDYIHDCVM